MNRKNIAVVASNSQSAQAALIELTERYTTVEPDYADVIVALGGDGFMLETQHRFMGLKKPIYGMNRGTVGFLMNEFSVESLPDRILRAESSDLHPLCMKTKNIFGETHEALAINEVSLLRQTRQAAKVEIYVDGVSRVSELICDGVLVATPAGSTAYNLSAHGSILPLDSKLLALTPISAFRPRRWKGRIVSDKSKITIKNLNINKRPISAVADNYEVRNAKTISIKINKKVKFNLLYDSNRSLQKKIKIEQLKPRSHLRVRWTKCLVQLSLGKVRGCS